MLIYCIIWITFTQICQGEQPLASCASHRPFKTADNTCGKFSDICYKKADPNCEQFLNVCQQCPISNFSFLIFQDVVQMKDASAKSFKILKEQISGSTNHFDIIINKTKDDHKIMKRNINIIIIIIIILFIITILVLIIEIRFKLLTKSLEKTTKKGKKLNYRKLKKLKYEDNYDFESNLLGKVLDFETNLNFKILELHDQLKIMMNKLPKVTETNEIKSFVTIKFQMKDQPKLVELLVHEDDNVVKIKKKICSHLINIKPDDYKIMKLKYNGIVMDDNDYLLGKVESKNVIINCEFDNKSFSNNIIVLQVKGNRKIPEYIQMDKSQKIVDIKRRICSINNKIHLSNLKIFKDSKELLNEETLNKSNLKDLDTVQIIEKEVGELIIKLLFDDRNVALVDLCNFDLVSEIKIKLARELNIEMEDIIFIFGNNYLNNNSIIFEMDINNESEITYFHYKNINKLILDESCFATTNFSCLFKAKDETINKEIVLKRYEREQIKDEDILSDLNPYQTIRSNPGFVQLFDLYRDDKYFYCAMELMEQGSFEDLIKDKEKYPISEILISKWSKQILQAMKYMHLNRYDQGNMRPSCFLIDKNDNVKIATFGLSTVLYGYKLGFVEENFSNIYQGIMRYMAPETFQNKNVALQCNIWSFGAIIMELATGRKPYHNLSEKEAAQELINNKIIEYDHTNMTAKLKLFIDRCLVVDPEKRATVEELRNNIFVTD